MHCLSRQNGVIYWWPRRRWAANTLASARSSSNKAVIARQTNNKKPEQVTAYDTPFADVGRPIPRNGTDSKRPMPKRQTPERERRLHELGRKAMEAPNGTTLGAHLTDAKKKKTAKNTPIQADGDTAGGAEDVKKRPNGPGDHSKEEDAADEWGALPSGGDQSVETGSALSNEYTSTWRPLIFRQEDPQSRSRSQEEVWLAESLRKFDEQALDEPSETSETLEGTPDMLESKKIYIAGTNAAAKFIAHALVGSSKPPPVTLLVPRPGLVKQWYDEGCTIKKLWDLEVDERSGVDIQLVQSYYDGRSDRTSTRIRDHHPLDTPIDNLVITTDGRATLRAIEFVQHRLKPSSTILFMKDTLAILNYVNASFFPDPAERPNYIMGSMTHKVYGMEDNFNFSSHERGYTSLTRIPREREQSLSEDGEKGVVRRLDHYMWPSSAEYLLSAFGRAYDLNTTFCRFRSFLRHELENMAITAILGPLTVIHECNNNQLLQNPEVTLTIRQLAADLSLIIRSLPEVAGHEEFADSFGWRRLKTLVFSAIMKSGGNQNPMYKSVRKGMESGIEYSTEYFFRRGRELGIDCPRLDMLATMVKAKERIRKREFDFDIPFL